MPVAAVSAGGRPRVRIGSRMTVALQLRRQLAIPHTLREIGLDADVADWVGEQAVADISSSDTNAQPLDAHAYSQIYRNAVHGDLPAVFRQ